MCNIVKYMSLLRLMIFMLLVFASGSGLQAQMPISEADAQKFGFKKVVKYLEKALQNGLNYFSEIQPSVKDGNDLSAFHFHSATYRINAPVGQVWNTCMTTSPVKLWEGKMLGLSCVYSSNSDKIFYRDDTQFDAPELHQIYFINLRIMRLFNVAAALMTTKIDGDENFMEFTYIEGNKSTGKQTVRLVATGDGATQIVHETFYASGSKFRDKRLYPRFHQIAITDLHEKIDRYSNVEVN